MANVEVKLVKADYVDFLNSVAEIKTTKRQKLHQVVELANTLYDDYLADLEEGRESTLAELEESFNKVLQLATDLQIRKNLDGLVDAMYEEASKRPVEKKKKKTPKKKDEPKQKEEPKQEEPQAEEGETRFPKDVEIGDLNLTKVLPKDVEELRDLYANNELYLLSFWGDEDDFDADDYDVLGITDEGISLINGYDLMYVVHVGNKTAIAVSNYNEVNTTLVQDDLDTLDEQLMSFYIAVEEGEEE